MLLFFARRIMELAAYQLQSSKCVGADIKLDDLLGKVIEFSSNRKSPQYWSTSLLSSATHFGMSRNYLQNKETNSCSWFISFMVATMAKWAHILSCSNYWRKKIIAMAINNALVAIMNIAIIVVINNTDTSDLRLWVTRTW